jgi:hypothetical protein
MRGVDPLSIVIADVTVDCLHELRHGGKPLWVSKLHLEASKKRYKGSFFNYQSRSHVETSAKG